MNILIQTMHNFDSYSGGRYLSWIMTEACASAGFNVTVWTNCYPILSQDFIGLKDHNHINLIVDDGFRKFPEGKYDVVIVIPHKYDPVFHEKSLYIAKKNHAKVILLNFETLNWYNKFSPEPRSESDWVGWRNVAKYSDMILSLAKEGTKYAKEYYKVEKDTLFKHCYPGINSQVADSIKIVKKEKQIICITRFVLGNKHKGGFEIIKILSPEMKGWTLILLIGSGRIDNEYYIRLLEKANKYGVKIKILSKIDDRTKYLEIKKSSLMVFLSYFEGFGYPPVEAQYCNVPCIVYDLPILREVNKNLITYVAPGDIDGLQKQISKIISSKNKLTNKQYEFIKDYVSFDSYSKNIKKHCIEVCKKERFSIDNYSLFSDKNFKIFKSFYLLKLFLLKLFFVNKESITLKTITYFGKKISNIVWLIIPRIYLALIKQKNINDEQNPIVLMRNKSVLYNSSAEKMFYEIKKNSGEYNIAISGDADSIEVFSCIIRNYSDQLNWNNINIFWADNKFKNNNVNLKKRFYELIKNNQINLYDFIENSDNGKIASEYAKIIANHFSISINELPKFNMVIKGFMPNENIFLENETYNRIGNIIQNDNERINIDKELLDSSFIRVFINSSFSNKRKSLSKIKKAVRLKNEPFSYENKYGQTIWYISC